MEIQTRIFTYDQQEELNKFLQTANLYNTESAPAIRMLEEHVIVFHLPEPNHLSKKVAAETLHVTVRKLKENLVQYEADIRQFGWRMDEKRAAAADIRKQLDELDGKLKPVIEEMDKLAKTKENRERREELQGERNRIGDERKALQVKLTSKGAKDSDEDVGLDIQIENAEENTRITKGKIETTKKDIEMSLKFIADIESGEYKIYAQ